MKNDLKQFVKMLFHFCRRQRKEDELVSSANTKDITVERQIIQNGIDEAHRNVDITFNSNIRSADEGNQVSQDKDIVL